MYTARFIIVISSVRNAACKYPDYTYTMSIEPIERSPAYSSGRYKDNGLILMIFMYLGNEIITVWF